MKKLSFILSLLISFTAFSQAGAYLHDLESANSVNANDSIPIWQLDGKTRSVNLQKVKDFIGAEPAIIAPLQVARYMNGYKKFVQFNADSIPAGNTNIYYSNTLVQAFSDTRYSLLSHIHAASEITSGNLAYQRIATGTPQIGYVPVYSGGNIISWQLPSGAGVNYPLYKDGNGYYNIPLAGPETDGYLSGTHWNLFNNKQDQLNSGINIKTINNQSILGPGNISLDSLGSSITTDATPTIGSTNAVQSGGVYNALQGKASNSITVNGQPLSGNVNLSKSDVGLSNVDNTSDANKNSATAALTNKDLSSPTNTFPSSLATLSGAQTLTNKTLASPVITSPTGITKADVGLSNVDNTSDANKPISTATQTALNGKQNTLGYTPENSANKKISGNLGASTSLFPVEKVVRDALDSLAAIKDTFQLKTINGQPITGTGDIVITGGSSGPVSGMPTVNNIAALKTIDTAKDGTSYFVAGYSTIADGGGGTFTWNATSTATADNALIIQANGVTTGRFIRHIYNNEIYLKWWGTQSDWRSILKAVTPNYTVNFEPNATYTISDTLGFKDCNINWKLNRATINFSVSGSRYLLTQEATAAAPTAVTSIVYDGSTSSGLTSITISGAFSCQVGDLLRIYSDDKVAVFNTNGDVRAAEFIVPIVVTTDGSGNTVLKIQRYLKYHYTTAKNIRIAKINKYTCNISNGTIRATGGIAGGFHLIGITAPDFTGLDIQRLQYPAFTLRGCYKAHIYNNTIDAVEDNIGGPGPSGATGYGVNDNNSFYTHVDHNVFTGLRHAFTTGGQTNLGALDNHNWRGEPYGTLVDHNDIYNTQHAIDTHEQGRAIVFDGNNIFGAVAAYQIRAREVTINGGTADSVGTFLQSGASTMAPGDPNVDSTFRVVVNNVTIRRLAGNIVKVPAPTQAIMQAQITFNNCNIEGKDFDVVNTKLNINNNTILLRYGANQLITADSSKIEAVGNRITSDNASNFYFGLIQDSTILFGKDNIITLPSATNIYLSRAQSTSGLKKNIVHLYNTLFKDGNGPAAASATSGPWYSSNSNVADIKLSWRTDKMDGSSSAAVSSCMTLPINAGTTTWYNDYLDDQTIFVNATGLTGNTDISLVSIKNGTRIGQQLVIYNSSTSYTLTLPALNQSSPQVLPARGTKIITWTGSTWVY